MRGVPSTSKLGWPAMAALAESIAGDPAVKWKFPPATFVHLGLAWIAWASCPDADRKAASEV